MLQLTPENNAELKSITEQLLLLDQLEHTLRCRRNAIIGLPAPLTLAEIMSQAKVLLEDQYCCALDLNQELDSGTEADIRREYTERNAAFSHFEGEPPQDHWLDDDVNEDDRSLEAIGSVLVELGHGYLICSNFDPDEQESSMEVWSLQLEDSEAEIIMEYEGNIYIFENAYPDLASAREYALREHSRK